MGLKLMCVVAHPDDECFAFGGALSLAADREIETYVLCLTDGQAATARGTAMTGEELGKLRRAEFAWSLRSFPVSPAGSWSGCGASGRIWFSHSGQTGRLIRMQTT